MAVHTIGKLKRFPIKLKPGFSRRSGSAILVYSILLFHPTFTVAEPTGGNIVGGSGSINTQGLTTNIQQNSHSLAIDWNSFNINQNEKVNFIQPGSSSIALNRILGNNASQIMKTIPGIHTTGHAEHVQI